MDTIIIHISIAFTLGMRNFRFLKSVTLPVVHPCSDPTGISSLTSFAVAERIINQVEVSRLSARVTLFKRIIVEHFANEIPESTEVCPKCHSLDTWTHILVEEKYVANVTSATTNG